MEAIGRLAGDIALSWFRDSREKVAVGDDDRKLRRPST